MIETWLQISCDDDCGTTQFATASGITVAQFRAELGQTFVRMNGRDVCKQCADVRLAKQSKESAERAMSTEPSPLAVLYAEQLREGMRKGGYMRENERKRGRSK